MKCPCAHQPVRLFRLLVSPKQRTRSPRFDVADPLLDSKPVDNIDLHGFSAVEARFHLEAWIKRMSRQHPRGIVLVVTGKGRGSAGGGVLKPLVRSMLKGGLTTLISDWSEDVGGGGYRIRLR